MKIKAWILISLMAAAGACKKSGDAAANGNGCAGLDPNSAIMRCTNNNVEFCSSHSRYRWTETQKCPADKKCFISPDGKSGGCK